ncbi:MAG: LCP family protein [Anaerolineales bacterium]|nr:LCP family protein [Anaerolineales bacterium]
MKNNPVFQRISSLGSRLRGLPKRRLFLLAVPLALVLICLGVYSGIRSYAPAAARVSQTPSATPFQPATETSEKNGRSPTRGPKATVATLAPLATPTASGVAPPWSPYAGPIHPASTQIPLPAEVIDPGPGTITIALLGIDKSETAGAYRTDAIMILHLNRERNLAAVISFPRDLYVYIPAYGMQRINIAFQQGRELHYPGGAFELFRDTMKYNFGLQVDHYALMNFQGFKDMVDKLDGIDVQVGRTYTDYRYGYGNITVEAGERHMDGSLALWYVRARQASSDFDRTRRQQEVIVAVAQRLLDLRAIPNLPGFFKIFMEYFESDLTLDDITPFADMAGSVSLSSLRRYRVTTPDGCSNWTTPQGGMVLLPKYDAIRAMLEAALAPPE